MIIPKKIAITIILLSQSCYLIAGSFGKIYSTSNTYDLCLENSPDRYSYLQCINTELKYQDRILNINYEKAMKTIQEFRKSKLKITQRAWMEFRDQKYSFYYHKESGSGGLEDQQTCLVQETIKRANELDKLY